MNITYSIIGVTVLTSLYAFNRADITRQFIMNPYLVMNRHQYYRFVTSGFIHKDYMHLLWNILSFYFFGTVVEDTFRTTFGMPGGIYFVIFYVLGIVISDVPSYFRHRHNPGYNALGASGGVSAVIFASILFEPLRYVCIYFALCLPGFILGILYLIWSYFQGKRGRDNINHDAHLYGALFGLLFCIIMYPASITRFFSQIMQWRMFSL